MNEYIRDRQVQENYLSKVREALVSGNIHEMERLRCELVIHLNGWGHAMTKSAQGMMRGFIALLSAEEAATAQPAADKDMSPAALRRHLGADKWLSDGQASPL